MSHSSLQSTRLSSILCHRSLFFVEPAEERRGPDLEMDLQVTLEDIYLGKSFTVCQIIVAFSNKTCGRDQFMDLADEDKLS